MQKEDYTRTTEELNNFYVDNEEIEIAKDFLCLRFSLIKPEIASKGDYGSEGTGEDSKD